MRMQISHAVVYVCDLPAMLDFYGQLGFTVSDRSVIGPDKNIAIAFVSTDPDAEHHQLAFVQVKDNDDPPNSVDHVAFRVESLDDVRAAHALVRADDRASDIKTRSHGTTWSVYLKDPEGNGLEIFCDTPWHVDQPQGDEWDPTLTDDELLAWTENRFKDEPGFTRRGR
jgi:catechol 2,3-dioxygenase-like lactoylglutathione lyase family enzyme